MIDLSVYEGRNVPLVIFLLLAPRFNGHTTFYGGVHLLAHIILVVFFTLVIFRVPSFSFSSCHASALSTPYTGACDTRAIPSIALLPLLLAPNTVYN